MRFYSGEDEQELFRWSLKRSIGGMALSWAQPPAARPPPRSREKRGACAAIPWPCFLFAAITWVIILHTGSRWERAHARRGSRKFFMSTGFGRTGVENFCGRATEKTAAC